MFVVAQVSSRKISREASSFGCRLLQAARASAMSGRSCSAARRRFFQRQTPAGAASPTSPDGSPQPRAPAPSRHATRQWSRPTARQHAPAARHNTAQGAAARDCAAVQAWLGPSRANARGPSRHTMGSPRTASRPRGWSLPSPPHTVPQIRSIRLTTSPDHHPLRPMPERYESTSPARAGSPPPDSPQTYLGLARRRCLAPVKCSAAPTRGRERLPGRATGSSWCVGRKNILLL